ncbi:MAG TPA: LysM peptidoglycan-binding domain-containing protein [Verrucomicrobiae bacterium]|nr:LysM peptidoglycan-binding domain-containing protein [Verrucomicrobiae bacterium]
MGVEYGPDRPPARIRSRARLRRPANSWRRHRRVLRRAGLLILLIYGLLMPVAWGAPAGNIGALTVRPGETLWSIAVQRYPGSDPRVVIPLLERANRVHGTVIQPGVRLLLPAI